MVTVLSHRPVLDERHDDAQHCATEKKGVDVALAVYHMHKQNKDINHMSSSPMPERRPWKKRFDVLLSQKHRIASQPSKNPNISPKMNSRCSRPALQMALRSDFRAISRTAAGAPVG